MAANGQETAGVVRLRESPRDGADERLMRLCAEFFRQADARTREGERLDGLDWSSDVDAGYRQLSRGAPDYRAMLDAILAAAPTTIQGLGAKARVVSRHQQDREAEPIPSTILASDVIRLLGSPAQRSAAFPTRDAGGRQDMARPGGGSW